MESEKKKKRELKKRLFNGVILANQNKRVAPLKREFYYLTFPVCFFYFFFFSPFLLTFHIIKWVSSKFYSISYLSKEDNIYIYIYIHETFGLDLCIYIKYHHHYYRHNTRHLTSYSCQIITESKLLKLVMAKTSLSPVIPLACTTPVP